MLEIIAATALVVETELFPPYDCPVGVEALESIKVILPLNPCCSDIPDDQVVDMTPVMKEGDP
jgi:hypothetical protein